LLFIEIFSKIDYANFPGKFGRPASSSDSIRALLSEICLFVIVK